MPHQAARTCPKRVRHILLSYHFPRNTIMHMIVQQLRHMIWRVFQNESWLASGNSRIKVRNETVWIIKCFADGRPLYLPKYRGHDLAFELYEMRKDKCVNKNLSQTPRRVLKIAVALWIAIPHIFDIPNSSILFEISATKRNTFNCDLIWMLIIKSMNIGWRSDIRAIGPDAQFSVSKWDHIFISCRQNSQIFGSNWFISVC
jgi:hypothetical protein